MNTGNSQQYEFWAPEERPAAGSVIYLDAHRRKCRREKNSAAAWNVIFTVLAVAMIFCIFIR